MKCPFTEKKIQCEDPDCSEATCPIRGESARKENDQIAANMRDYWKQRGE